MSSTDSANNVYRPGREPHADQPRNRANEGLERVGKFFAFSLNKEPFDDLRVRQAMQMALDHETINNTYFKGYGNWVPQGRLSSDMTGYTTPFAEWPEEVKKYWTYDPEGAEALLDAAGLPRGADGIRFKTVLNRNVGGYQL